MKKALSTFILLALTSLCLTAQIPNGYYNNAAGKTGDDLKSALHNIIKGHTSISYSQVWNAFWSTDNKGNGVVWDMYSDVPNGTPPYTFDLGQNQCGSYSDEGDCFNREHSWPESWFNSQNNTPRTDLHHIFPTDGYVNQQRGNLPFGEVGGTTLWTSLNGSKIGNCSVAGYSDQVFEPIDEYKGDFARALFYVSVRYYGEDDNWGSSGMTNKSEIKPWAIDMLLRWNDEDPVSQKEIDRNNVIYSEYQHNRNPFVDHPEYASMIWGENAQVGKGNYVKVTEAPADWSGEYLIVYEAGNKAFDGGLATLDAANNNIPVTITNGEIEADEMTDAARFTIAKYGNSYTIRSASGQFIGKTQASNGMNTSATVVYTNTISLDANGNAVITGTGGYTLRFNAASSQMRFRYYSNGTQQPVTLYKKTASFKQKYHLVTSTDQLVAGRKYLIVNTNYQKALGAKQNTNNRSAAAVSVFQDTISSIDSTVCVLTLGGQSGAWTFYDDGNNGYLYAAGGTGNNNYLKTQSSLTDEGRWLITLDNNHTATIKTIAQVNRHTIKYNYGSNVFSCYSSGQQPVWLFVLSEEYVFTENTTIAHLFPFDKHTIRSGATLTVTGTTSCNDPSLLVIQDGGQLVHHSDGVQATCRKSIASYTNSEVSDGWYTIAMPFTSFDPASGLTTNQFDLYAYDDEATLEWVNYKSGSFNLASGQGYLYAHNPSTVVRMVGTLSNGDYSPTVNLNYSDSNPDVKSWTLLGNPTAHEITFTKTEDVSDGYYYIDNGNAWTYTSSNVVPACRGFLVKANADNQTVTLNQQSSAKSGDDGRYLCLSIGNERVYVKLNEGVSMPLASFYGRHSALYFISAHRPYAMMVRNGAASLDFCYEPKGNGTQTLVADAEGLGLEYLHLVDHLTGADIDLLQTPEYTFTSRVSDYIGRFQLVFAEGGTSMESGETDFAYFNGSEWVISDTYADGNIEVVDMLGRVVAQGRNTSRNISTRELSKGVYVLRLTTETGVKVQKITIGF